MNIIPTPRLIKWLAAGMVIALLAFAFPGLELAILPFNLGLIGLAVFSAISAPKLRELVVERRFDQVLSVRAQNRVVLAIRNDGADTIHGRLRDCPPPDFDPSQVEFPLHLLPNQDTEIAYHVCPKFRGTDEFGDVLVRVLGRFGLVEVEHRIPCSREARVYPNVLALREFELLKQRGKLNLMGIRKSRIKGQGTEFESLRDYHDDDYRRIDWKSTARRGKLVVRDYETEKNQPVIVCMDVGRNMLAEVDGVPKLDIALDASLMLLHAAKTAGDQTGLLVFAERVISYVPPIKSRGQTGILLDAIHDLAADAVESNYDEAMSYLASRWKRRSLIVIFTDAEDEAQAKKLSTALSAIRRRHLVMVVRVADPDVREMARLKVETDTDVYHRASGLWYQTERQLAEFKLSAGGVRSIDAEPKDLAQALVSAYLVAKETAAL